MDFTLSKQQQMVQKMYKEFAENEVKPFLIKSFSTRFTPLRSSFDLQEFYPQSGEKSPSL